MTATKTRKNRKPRAKFMIFRNRAIISSSNRNPPKKWECTRKPYRQPHRQSVRPSFESGSPVLGLYFTAFPRSSFWMGKVRYMLAASQ